MSKADEIKRKLVENAEKVDEFIMEALKPREPKVLYEASHHLIKAGGKRLRPYLTVKACEAVGGIRGDAVPFAAALEVLHNFTLVHDDVMDNDDLRRGAPTVHKKWDVPLAILAGDLLFAKVFEFMSAYAPESMPPRSVVRCIHETSDATIILCEGQAMDVAFPDKTDVSEEEYIAMVGGKTSALFRACAKVGAIVGGGTDSQVEALGRFAWDAGVAFQIVDDILGITADEKELGKPIGSDIREGKKTIIVIHALENCTPEQRETLDRALGNEDATQGMIEAAKKVLDETGSVKYAREKAESYLASAFSMLDKVPVSTAREDLRALVNYFVERSY